MNWIAQLLAVAVAATLLTVGALEAFQFRNQRFRPIFLIRPEDYDAVRLWVVNLGFYNMVWGAGILLGVLLLNFGNVTVGATMVIFGCAAHVILGVVLAVSEPKLIQSALGQALLPLAAIIVAWWLPA
jgi:putative membrane protein